MVAVPLLSVLGCTQEMYDQPRYEPLEASEFFSDDQSVRPAVDGTVARDELWLDHPFFTGHENAEPVTRIPADPRSGSDDNFVITREVLERGRECFEIYCSMCHGRTGFGDGMVVKRGFRAPPSLHEPRLRHETPPGHFFDVITNGFRTMPAQGPRIAPSDRWAIVAYLRALQLSQHVVYADAPADVRDKFD
jgi:cytochrome c5